MDPQTPFTMTGTRAHKALLFYFHDHPLLLSANLADIVVSMIVAKLDHDEGFTTATALEIFRLRKRLDAIRPGSGMELIEVGIGDEYRLTIPREEIADRVLVTNCFFQLVDRKVISQAHADMLRQHLRVIPLSQFKEEMKARQLKSK
jgi:hypothetical protein